MATNITPVDTFTTTITIPTDGDAVNGTEVALTTQALANRGENNNSRINNIPVASSGGVILGMSGSMCQGDFSTGAPAMFISQFRGAWLTTNGTTASKYLVTNFTHVLPPVAAGATLTQVTYYLTGGSVHFPANLPTVEVRQSSVISGAGSVLLGSATDPSTNGTEYADTHTIVVSGLAHTILVDTTYTVILNSESGAGVTANDAEFIAVEIHWTLP